MFIKERAYHGKEVGQEIHKMSNAWGLASGWEGGGGRAWVPLDFGTQKNAE